MKFLRYTLSNITSPGVLINDILYDLKTMVPDINNKTIEILTSQNIDITKLKTVNNYDKLETLIDGVLNWALS